MLKKNFPFIVKLCLVSVYVIFLAGSVVRMTGSGMGCPDWPKCFGYYIPPTSEDQLLWKPNKKFNKGVVIIKNETLFVAQKRLQTTNTFKPENWKKYTKHDYSKFNVYHTWTEYINRLASAVSGFFFLFLLYGSLKFRKENKLIPILAFGAFALMLFEAWLGKMVVDTVLSPKVITLHMFGGLLIIGLLLILLNLVSKPNSKIQYNSLFNKLLIVATILTFIQIILGTQVRQFVDEQVKLYGFDNKKMSLLAPNVIFYIHRSFSIALVLVNFWLLYLNETKKLNVSKINWIVALLMIEVITGILMYYVDFPIGTQAIHLVFGIILFGMQCYAVMESRKLSNVTID